jgi:diguanylate cyclase (GGDEF)-like protein
MARRERAALLIGAVVTGGYFLLAGDAAKDAVYLLVGAAATVALLLAGRRSTDGPGGWFALAAATGCFVLGDSIFDVYDLVLHRAAPTPSVADLLYLGGYPLLFVGVARRVRPASGAARRETAADAVIASVGILAASWPVLMSPYARDGSTSVIARLVAVAYPVMDVGVLFVVVLAVLRGSARRPSDRLLVAAIAMMLVADSWYDFVVLYGSYSAGHPVDAPFLLNYVLLAAAALHPSAAEAPVAVPDRPASTRHWLPLVGGAGLVAPVVLLVDPVLDRRVDTAVLAWLSMVLFVLVVVRMAWMFRRIQAQTRELERRGESLSDALHAQRQLEEELRHQAFHDSLTGLANRALLHDRIDRALLARSRVGGGVAVYFCDLDGFKEVNDTLGHDAGDAVLVTVAQRLAQAVRAADTVARLGGDEFAVVISDMITPEMAVGLAERLVALMNEPIETNGVTVRLSASVGMAVADAASTATRLLSDADAAMYQAKAAGKNQYAVFDASMRTRLTNRMLLRGSFDGALDRGEFVLEYQPQFDLATDELTGFEALVRWQHPSLGLLDAAQFIDLAEDTGFIVPLGRWILETACGHAADWPSSGGAPVGLSVNLSTRQLVDPATVADISTALAYTGLEPSRLTLEIPEAALMQNPGTAAAVLRELRALGVRLAIDDVGAELAVLTQLRRLPIDTIKLERNFLIGLAAAAPEAVGLAGLIGQIAEDLSLRTIAQGVETQQQKAAVAAMHWNGVQGFAVARPLTADATRPYIAARRRPDTASA